MLPAQPVVAVVAIRLDVDRADGSGQKPITHPHLAPKASGVLRLDVPVVGLPTLQAQPGFGRLRRGSGRLPANDVAAAGVAG